MTNNDFEKRKKIILELMNDKAYVPMKIKELAIVLNVKKEDRDSLLEVLDALINEGKISMSKRGKYGIGMEEFLTGTFQATAKGFGFVVPDSLGDDVFISEKDINTAFHGDKVKYIIKKRPVGDRRGEGKIVEVLERRYTEVVGTFERCKNFGFLIPDDPKIGKDIYVPRGKDMGANDREKVVVKIDYYGDYNRKPEGIVIEKIGMTGDPGVDIVSVIKAFGIEDEFSNEVNDYLRYIPEEVNINLYKTVAPNTGTSNKTLAERQNYISEEISNNASAERQNNISEEISNNASAETSMGAVVEETILPETVSGDNYRLDLRAIKTVTIDGEDAKDLDDAISIERLKDGYRLYVSIADVSEYVKENSPLDKTARERGTSVYLVDRVIPMLPKKLSNGICSLNQGEDRLALSCIMDFDSEGNIKSHRIEETVICVDRRMSYNKVQEILDLKNNTDLDNIDSRNTDLDNVKLKTLVSRNTASLAEYKDFVSMFELMLELSRILRKKRYARGSMNFDSKESKFTLDENGRVLKVEPYDRCEAMLIIEDFMLAANETVAEEYFWAGAPFVYRSHEEPDEEKIKMFGIFINNFGHSIHFSNGKIYSKELQKVLEAVKDSPEEAVINRMLLRSMKKANYTTTADGHFGLAAKYYCHFTSPIRRYPDLQIHRIIKENIHGKLDAKRTAHYNNILPEVTLNSSITERRANDAEMETEKIKKVEYMQDKIGEMYDGIISGLTSWGIYVELPNTVEGMVRLKDIKGDYYDFVEDKMLVIGERTGKAFKLGEQVRVKVLDVDFIGRTIDFEFVY